MVNSKKLLSIFLAVVMVFSTLAVMVSAEDIADGVNVKYTVEKVDTVPETEAGSAEWSADNIYAVTVWMKASMGVDFFTAPVHYNKTKFAPITLSDGECTYPYGAGIDQDSYVTEMGEGAIYAYTLGDFLNNTGMYKADGSTATTKALAKCIGLGNANSAGVSVTAEFISPDHSLYGKWGAGLDADTGVLFVNLDVATNAKTAYLNTIEGINYSTDWNRMFTVYFEAIDDDVNGAEFGVVNGGTGGADANFDGSGSGYYVSAAAYSGVRPAMNISENATVEVAAEPVVYPVKRQIQWADQAAGKVNLGVVAGFDVADIEIDFDNTGKATNVTSVGATVEIAGASSTKEERFVYEANGGDSYYFRTVIAGVDADYDGDIVVTPFVVYNGETLYADAITISAADLASYVEKIS